MFFLTLNANGAVVDKSIVKRDKAMVGGSKGGGVAREEDATQAGQGLGKV